MKILHLVPGLDSPANGIAVAARLIAAGQGAELVDCSRAAEVRIERGDEVWVHSMWTPTVWRACRAPRRAGAKLVRMTHGCLDPRRVAYHGWKKFLAAPIERRLFSTCDRVAVTGAWERDWCERWGVKGPFEIVDLKRFFAFPPVREPRAEGRPLHLLYLGRRHPLKGLDALETAVAEVRRTRGEGVELRIVSDAFGEEKACVWAWCDVLVLPTLSENFGLVVAEALARGKPVITTDGAPAWENQPGVVYLKGFRDGSPARRVELLVGAIGRR